MADLAEKHRNAGTNSASVTLTKAEITDEQLHSESSTFAGQKPVDRVLRADNDADRDDGKSDATGLGRGDIDADNDT